jgi:hypothetical protein
VGIASISQMRRTTHLDVFGHGHFNVHLWVSDRE